LRHVSGDAANQAELVPILSVSMRSLSEGQPPISRKMVSPAEGISAIVSNPYIKAIPIGDLQSCRREPVGSLGTDLPKADHFSSREKSGYYRWPVLFIGDAPENPPPRGVE